VGRIGLYVPPPGGGRGVGSALLARVSRWLRERGCGEATSETREGDEASLAWAGRRGFVEIGRNSLLALHLASTEAPEVTPPEGIEIVTWASRPELTRGLHDVYCEAAPDIPGEDAVEAPSFESWLANDMQGESDRPDAVFVALAGAEVVGYAKLAIRSADNEIAFHDLTGVKRAWRGRGIAAALKRAEIRWAKENGYAYLKTMNEERNEPIRRLNERHGYRLEPGFVTVRGRLVDGPATRPS
jgi:GNAT superfamily N-acetyltransferase